VQEVETPKAGSADVLLKVAYCGVCGSDVPRIVMDAAHYYPIILGHEFSGVIAEVGDDLNPDLIGKKAVCAPLIPDFSDPQSIKGNYSLCKDYDFIGSRRPGGFAEYVAMPAGNAILLEDSANLLSAVFIEPLTVALHAINIMAYRPGRTAAVIGAGGIGLLMLQCLKQLGSRHISVFDVDDNKLELAANLGAQFHLNPQDEDAVKAAFAQAAPNGYDYVFEASGAPTAEILALKLAAPRGCVMYVGTPHAPLTLQPAEFELINRKELTLQGSWLNYSAPFPGWEWEYGAGLITKQQIDTGLLVGRILPLSQADRLPALLSETGGLRGKIVLDCLIIQDKEIFQHC
jgi:threonine dehydrogenase-like Zn-dependent dehydrogenase